MTELNKKYIKNSLNNVTVLRYSFSHLYCFYLHDFEKVKYYTLKIIIMSHEIILTQRHK